MELQKEYAGDSPCARSENGTDDGDGRHGAVGEHTVGIGRARRRNPAGYLFEHGGSALFQCDMVGYPSGDGVVVLSNGGGGGSLSDQIVRSVAQAYAWPDFQPVDLTVVPVDPSKFRRYLGTYDFFVEDYPGREPS